MKRLQYKRVAIRRIHTFLDDPASGVDSTYFDGDDLVFTVAGFEYPMLGLYKSNGGEFWVNINLFSRVEVVE